MVCETALHGEVEHTRTGSGTTLRPRPNAKWVARLGRKGSRISIRREISSYGEERVSLNAGVEAKDQGADGRGRENQEQPSPKSPAK